MADQFSGWVAILCTKYYSYTLKFKNINKFKKVMKNLSKLYKEILNSSNKNKICKKKINTKIKNNSFSLIKNIFNY